MTSAGNSIPEDEIQWGVLIALPGGATTTEIHRDRVGASLEAKAINRQDPDGVPAQLVYRQRKAGEWTQDLGSRDEFGLTFAWPDGHSEEHLKASRVDAERDARLHNGRGNPGTATVVARSVAYGDWWLATGSGA